MTENKLLLSDEELDEVAAHLPLIKAWMTAIEAELVERLEAGSEFEHVRLVPKRADRKWTEGVDPLKILRRLGKLDVIAPRKPLTPAQAEKALGRTVYAERLAEFVSKESSGMKLDYPA